MSRSALAPGGCPACCCHQGVGLGSGPGRKDPHLVGGPCLPAHPTPRQARAHTRDGYGGYVGPTVHWARLGHLGLRGCKASSASSSLGLPGHSAGVSISSLGAAGDMFPKEAVRGGWGKESRGLLAFSFCLGAGWPLLRSRPPPPEVSVPTPCTQGFLQAQSPTPRPV